MDPRDRAVFGLWFAVLALTGGAAAVLGFPNPDGRPIAETLESYAYAVPESYELEFHGRDGYLRAPEDASRADVMATVERIEREWGVRDVTVVDGETPNSTTTTEPSAFDPLDPAEFELEWDGSEREGSGVIPADDEPQLAAALGFEGFTRSVDHSLSPQTRASAVELGEYIGQELRRGRMIVSEDVVHVTAEAVDEEALNRVDGAFADRNEVELQLTLPDPTEPTFIVRFNNNRGQVDAPVPATLVDDLETLGVDNPATDPSLAASARLREGFGALADAVRRGDLVRGRVDVVEGALAVEAQASSSAALATTESDLGDLAELDLVLSSDAAAAEVQATLDLVLAVVGPIEFEFGTAEPTAATEGLLDEIARVIVASPGPRIEVGGHTDNIGDPEANAALSLARADAVVSGLINRGVFAFRLEAVGYGDTEPIADNETPEGRQTNRRVELNVKEGR